MKLDEIKYAFANIMHRKLRSSLSILSILIGISAIFALVSFGLGIQAYVDNLAKESGQDKLFIQARGVGAPGTDDTFFLSKSDVDFISRVKDVSEATGLYNKPVEVVFKDQKKYNFLMGFDIEKKDFVEETFNVDIEAGKGLEKSQTNKVVLGHNYQLEKKIFERPVAVGDKITINDEVFTVAGFYSSLGNPQDDGNLYVTKEAFELLYPESTDKFGFVIARSFDGVSTKDLAEKIQDRLRKHKGQEKGKEDFFVQTFEDAIQTFQIIISVINGILILIALISVVVAAVNIMNTMYTAVLERTGEIGLMKAVGAKNKDILFIFIAEAGFIGLIGGLLGITLGYIVASIGGAAAAASGFSLLQPIFPPILIIGCVLFAFLIGAGAGFLPAYRASKLKPVEALRYE